MSFRFFNQRRVFILLAVALGFASQVKPQVATMLSSPPRHAVEMLVGFASGPLKVIADSIRRPADQTLDRGNSANLARNYDELDRAYNNLLQEKAALERELDLLRRFRRIRRMETTDPVEAEVTAWAGGPRQTLTLDRGTRDGIRPGLAVLDWYSFSLVGRVTDAGPMVSTVEMVTSPSCRVNVYFLPPSFTHLNYAPRIYQLNPVDRQGRFSVVIKAQEAKFVQAGYVAYLDDASWPRNAAGAVVGKVTAVRPWPENPNLFYQVFVTPIHALPNLTQVVVLVPVTAEQASGAAGATGAASGR